MKKILLVLFLVIFVLTGCMLSDNYAIGEKGPGGGVVFNAEDEYLEYIILKGNQNWEDADETAVNYTGGRYDNWRLPTRSELDDIYENLYKNDLIATGATFSYYWSSSDTSTNGKAWRQRFSDGHRSTDRKTDKNSVLVVRGWF